MPKVIMKKILILISIFIGLIAINANKAYAEEAKASGSSAKIQSANVAYSIEDPRVKVLRDFLKSQNSPLTPNAAYFVKEADLYNLDWKMVAAISGVESTFGQEIPYNSYNAWGWGVYGTNVIRFSSWDEGIATISEGLRNRYINQWGAQNVYQIGSLYAASPTWASHVVYYMNKIQDFGLRNPSDSLYISF
jgi:hypothetical protein